MPTNLTEVAQFTANVPAPNDGENANAASLIQAIQPLADRTQYLNAAVAEGACIGRRLLYAPGDGTVMIGRVLVVLGGKLYALAGGNLGVTGLAANTHYYVYVYVSAGALVTEYVPSPGVPDDALIFKSGDSTRRYIGPFVTNGSAVPIPMRYEDGECVFRRSKIASGGDPLLVLTHTTLTTWTDVPCATLVPPHARLVGLRGYGFNTSGTTVVQLRTDGDTTGEWKIAQIVGGNTVYFSCDIELSSAQKAEAQHVDASSSVGQTMYFYVTRFRE